MCLLGAPYPQLCALAALPSTHGEAGRELCRPRRAGDGPQRRPTSRGAGGLGFWQRRRRIGIRLTPHLLPPCSPQRQLLAMSMLSTWDDDDDFMEPLEALKQVRLGADTAL